MNTKCQFYFNTIIGEHSKMHDIYHTIKTNTSSDDPILIEGESGSGKELIAQAFHFESPRKDNPFIPVDCAAIPNEIAESTLFGHKKGAFTNAVSDYKGKFLLAQNGTLFLDNIQNLSLGIQAKILRAIENKKVWQLGSTEPTKTNIRIITASNVKLSTLISQKKFLLDLFYRLNDIKISLPPLRERVSDIPLLVNYFLREKSILSEALEYLLKYEFKGNVRELILIIKKAIRFSDNSVIKLNDILKAISEIKLEPICDLTLENICQLACSKGLYELENEIITYTYNNSKSYAKTATKLNITEGTVRQKLKKLLPEIS
ncbi:MAG: sigma-54 dependent transcriptional regulator [bacterium]|nr:sigma-54 dependent transcriptional regulator [bacterium]